MIFYPNCRPTLFFHSSRLKKDNKTGQRRYRMNFAITVDPVEILKCDEVIRDGYESIDTREKKCVRYEIGEDCPDINMRFFSLKDSPTPMIALHKLHLETLALTRVEGLVELWFSTELQFTKKLHDFVGEACFTRLWAEFEGAQKSLSIITDGTVEDELYEDAVKLVRDAAKASTSLLQRRLRISYSRASALLEAMENCGVVGPDRQREGREVLQPAEQPKRGRKGKSAAAGKED
jgi:ribosomal protein S25